MIEILKESKYFRSYTFSGSFDMSSETLSVFIEHYKKTGINLIDDYCEVVYLSWEYDNYEFYLTNDEFIKKQDSVSKIRELRKLDIDLIYDALGALSVAKDNLHNERERLYNEPRINAQKFIGKIKIREFIFKRDKYKCLKCGSTEKLTIDHINPVYNGGENKISNLQALCKSCNSKKGTKIIDYR